MWYAEDRLGKERIRGAYAWRSYLKYVSSFPSFLHPLTRPLTIIQNSNSGHITLGSDFPVESIDPLKGFYAAVTRKSPEGKSPHGKRGWYPEQRLSRVEVLRGFTVWGKSSRVFIVCLMSYEREMTSSPSGSFLLGAYASFSEDRVGSLTSGKKFDAVIWDDDLLTVPEDEMLDVKVKGVIVDGKLVWGTLG